MSREPESVAASEPPPLGIAGTAGLFGLAAILLFAATHGAIPQLVARLGVEPVVAWFVAGGLGTFLPLVLVGVLMLRSEGIRPLATRTWGERLRFRPMNAEDWAWAAGGTVATGLLMGLSVGLVRLTAGDVPLHPPFLSMEPLGPGRYWILAAWLPFWILNILGEEFLWRGVVLPRQETAFGDRAWIANAIGWFVFHLAFGPVVLCVVWPMLVVLPYVVQRRRNSWIGVVIHGGLNGPAFVAVAFGWL